MIQLVNVYCVLVIQVSLVNVYCFVVEVKNNSCDSYTFELLCCTFELLCCLKWFTRQVVVVSKSHFNYFYVNSWLIHGVEA